MASWATLSRKVGGPEAVPWDSPGASWGSVEGGYLCVWFLRRGGELVPRQVGCLVLSCQVLQLLSGWLTPLRGVGAPSPVSPLLGGAGFLFLSILGM